MVETEEWIQLFHLDDGLLGLQLPLDVLTLQQPLRLGGPPGPLVLLHLHLQLARCAFLAAASAASCTRISVL